MGCCSGCLPEKFLCRYSLKCGANVVAIFMFCLMLGISIALIVQVIMVKECKDCDKYLWRHVYCYTIVACINGVFMTLVNLWLLCGIRKEKTSVVLCWLVITGVWFVQSSALLVVLLCIYGSEVNAIAWVTSLVFAIIGLGIVLYEFLVVYAYWLELKTSKAGPVPAAN